MKGVSEITSAVMVLAVGVAVVSLYSQWAPAFAEGTVDDIVDQSNRRIKCSNAAISVEDALYDRTGEVLEFQLENTGTIRLSGGLYAGAFSSSLPINRTVVSQLGVEETRTVRISAGHAPDMVLVTSKDCPEIEARETSIEVQK